LADQRVAGNTLARFGLARDLRRLAERMHRRALPLQGEIE
jgi:hypothetical protein